MKAILTGLGGQGLNWLRQLRAHPDYEVVACVEPMAANRERAIREHGVKEDAIFDSLESAIAKHSADFVMDVTPPKVHAQIAKTAFDAGLHVLQEKPLSDDYNVAKEVVAAGKKAGKLHMITQNYRFGQQPRGTRRAIADGLIGKPGQCDVRFYMPWADLAGSHYVTQPYMLINDMMVHHFDMIRYVLGAEPQRVFGLSWNHPWGWHQGDAAHSITFFFEGGLVATHVSVGCAVGSQTPWNGDWRIEGPKGSISWDKYGTWFAHLHRAEERQHRELFLGPAGPGILDEFRDAIRENRQPECSAQDNLRSLAMVFGAIKSCQTGQMVELATL